MTLHYTYTYTHTTYRDARYQPHAVFEMMMHLRMKQIIFIQFHCFLSYKNQINGKKENEN